MIIRDELYGTVEISELEAKLIDCADFQRLHRIKQMAFTYLVYPGATHTRFEHSIGTMALASMMCERLGITGAKKEKVRLYGLLHDLGHLAFSHEGEHALETHLGDHEEIGRKKILSGEVAEVLCAQYAPKEILEVEKSHLGKIISSDLGADRMDYLKRDAQNTGVAYSAIDVDRILHTLTFAQGELCIEQRGLEAAESLLISRFMMFSTVYLHKTVRIAAAMLKRSILGSIEDKTLSAQNFLSMGDEEALLKMQFSKKAKPYADALFHRRLYKEAFSIDAEAKLNKNPEKLELELVRECNCDVIVDLPSKIAKPVDFKVKTGKGLLSITKVSDLIHALKASSDRRKKIIIMCPASERENVARIAKKLVG